MTLIKRARMLAGMTQEELGVKVGVSNVAVSNWENGKTFPDIKRLKRIAEVLGMPVDDLVDERVM